MDTLGYDLARKVLSAVVSYLPLAHIAGMVYIVCHCSNYYVLIEFNLPKTKVWKQIKLEILK